jgi:hypothetical protein
MVARDTAQVTNSTKGPELGASMLQKGVKKAPWVNGALGKNVAVGRN